MLHSSHEKKSFVLQRRMRFLRDEKKTKQEVRVKGSSVHSDMFRYAALQFDSVPTKFGWRKNRRIRGLLFLRHLYHFESGGVCIPEPKGRVECYVLAGPWTLWASAAAQFYVRKVDSVLQRAEQYAPLPHNLFSFTLPLFPGKWSCRVRAFLSVFTRKPHYRVTQYDLSN